jgi:hypothetical protein
LPWGMLDKQRKQWSIACGKFESEHRRAIGYASWRRYDRITCGKILYWIGIHITRYRYYYLPRCHMTSVLR